jgi:uncharacterized protein YneR
MNTLKDISSESIRQNWLNYKDEIYNSPYYELLWDSLESKFEIDKKNDQNLQIDERMKERAMNNYGVQEFLNNAELIENEGNPDLKLRVFVQGGGCSGFQYGFTCEYYALEDDNDKIEYLNKYDNKIPDTNLWRFYGNNRSEYF